MGIPCQIPYVQNWACSLDMANLDFGNVHVQNFYHLIKNGTLVQGYDITWSNDQNFSNGQILSSRSWSKSKHNLGMLRFLL